GNCFLSLNMISRKTMENPKKIIIFFRFQHFKYLVKCIPAMNYHRKFFSFCQLYLETEGFLLLFQKRFIPKKINSCFSHCKEFPGCKLLLNMQQFLFIILFDRCWVQPHH